MPANPAIEAYIRDAAIRRGIDPETAVRVARAEALNVFDPNRPDLGGDDGSSFGVYQLHYAGLSRKMPNAGLGDEFTKATGLDARDPSTWKQQVDFSLDHAKRHGWGAWMGAKNTGIGDWQGIKYDPSTYGGPGEGVGRSRGTDAYTTAQYQGNAQNQAISTTEDDPAATALAEALAMRDALTADDNRRSRSLLADTMANSVGGTSSGGGGITPSAADQPGAELPLEDFAPSATPEAPPEAARAPSVLGDTGTTTPLAEMFQIADIGMPNEIDPITGQPRLYRSRRQYG